MPWYWWPPVAAAYVTIGLGWSVAIRRHTQRSDSRDKWLADDPLSLGAIALGWPIAAGIVAVVGGLTLLGLVVREVGRRASP